MIKSFGYRFIYKGFLMTLKLLYLKAVLEITRAFEITVDMALMTSFWKTVCAGFGCHKR